VILKHIALALYKFLVSSNHFPTDVRSKDGEPLLSWRVRILPFLEQDPLFQDFEVDEPWDSPHNTTLLERMPATYAMPGSPAGLGMTFYRGFSGKSTLFDPWVPEGVAMDMITDGPQNTISVVEARDAVPWSKPDTDLSCDVQQPETSKRLLEALGGHDAGGFNALFCDGSVRFLRESIDPTVLRALVARDDRYPLAANSF
jgi:prepilin-type processing-associated H-X9-DG protein